MIEPSKKNNFINEDNSDILIDGDNNTTNITKTTKIGKGVKIGLSIGGITLGGTSGLVGYGVEHNLAQDRLHKLQKKEENMKNKILTTEEILKSSHNTDTKIDMLNLMFRLSKISNEEFEKGMNKVLMETGILYSSTKDNSRLIAALGRSLDLAKAHGLCELAKRIQAKIDLLKNK